VIFPLFCHPDCGLPSLFPVVGLPFDGLLLSSEAKGEVAHLGLVCGFVKASPTGGRGRGEDLPEGFPFGEGEERADAAALRRSSVAFSRASRASSSEVWDDTFCFFSETAASRSATLLSILKRSFRAREKERAIVDCGLPFDFHSRSSSSSDILWKRER